MNFKKLKGIFFDYGEDSENSEEKEEKKEEVVTEKNPTIPAPTAMPASPSENIMGETNEQIMDSLAKALENANLEGFDYFEFAKILDNLKEKMPSEQARFQAAFASANVMGAKKEKLLETAQHYLNTLDEENNKFETFYADQLKRTVEDKENRLNEIDLEISSVNETIEKLTNRINDLTNEKGTINNEIIENRGKAEKVKNDFTHTLSIFLKKIKNDIEKINKYITE